VRVFYILVILGQLQRAIYEDINQLFSREIRAKLAVKSVNIYPSGEMFSYRTCTEKKRHTSNVVALCVRFVTRYASPL
jgi:hypothetical protein